MLEWGCLAASDTSLRIRWMSKAFPNLQDLFGVALGIHGYVLVLGRLSSADYTLGKIDVGCECGDELRTVIPPGRFDWLLSCIHDSLCPTMFGISIDFSLTMQTFSTESIVNLNSKFT